MSAIIRKFRDTTLFAFVQGLIEHWNGCGGRTHATNQDWNEAYDRGMNLADLLRFRADLAKAKAKAAPPTYFDTEGREHQDARAMATERARQAIERAERIEGRLAQAEATVARQEGAIGAMEAKMMEAIGRALRAENALRAVEARETREGRPYVMAPPIVAFERAA